MMSEADERRFQSSILPMMKTPHLKARILTFAALLMSAAIAVSSRWISPYINICQSHRPNTTTTKI